MGLCRCLFAAVYVAPRLCRLAAVSGVVEHGKLVFCVLGYDVAGLAMSLHATVWLCWLVVCHQPA
jgi:hypothetical protein